MRLPKTQSVGKKKNIEVQAFQQYEITVQTKQKDIILKPDIKGGWISMKGFMNIVILVRWIGNKLIL